MNGISLGNPSAHDKVMDELGNNIKYLVAKNKKVTVLLNTPSGYFLDPRIMYPRTFLGTYGTLKNTITKESFLREHGRIIQEVAKIASDNGAQVIDPMDYLCSNGVCIAEDENGISIRFDEGHLRPGYVRDHVTFLDRTMAP